MARTTLTNLVKRAAILLGPIAQAQLANILQSKVLARDETPIKADQQKKGAMRVGWLWPVCGEDDEVDFSYSKGPRAPAGV